MIDSRKGMSIWKKFEKPKGDAKVQNDGKLYFRINKKTGPGDQLPGVGKVLEEHKCSPVCDTFRKRATNGNEGKPHRDRRYEAVIERQGRRG